MRYFLCLFLLFSLGPITYVQASTSTSISSSVPSSSSNQTQHPHIHQQIISSLKQINTLIQTQHYDQAYTRLDQLLLLTKLNNEDNLIALTLFARGNGYYAQKRYPEAIEQFSQALNYLSYQDKQTQKKRGEIYKKLAEIYKYRHNREKSAQFYQKTLTEYSAIKDYPNMAQTLTSLAEAERYLGHTELALDSAMKGLALYKDRVDDPNGKAKALKGTGIIYRYLGRYAQSLRYIYAAQKVYKQLKDTSGIANTSNEMGFIYMRLKDFEQALFYYQSTIDLAKKHKIKDKVLATALREMAVINNHYHQPKIARKMAQRANVLYERLDDKIKQALTARIIGNTYTNKQDINYAAFFYKKSYTLAQQVGSHSYQIKALVKLGKIFIGHDNNAAISSLQQAAQLASEAGFQTQQLYSYRALHQAEKLQGNIAQALNYAEKEIALSQNIKTVQDRQNLALMKAKLYSQQKEIELDSLKERTKLDQLALTKKNNEVKIAQQKIKIAALELTKNRYANITLAFLFASSLLVIILIYRRFSLSCQLNKKLDYLATRDHLTNCYNRRVLFDLLERDFPHITSIGEYSLIMVDIDFFKNINTHYGHSVGDVVLRGIAKVLQSSIRHTDMIVRYGGEEFCVILPGSSAEKAVELAEIMRKNIEESNFEGVKVTGSFGVTSIKFNAKTPRELIDQADMALYKSKEQGRNRVTLWDGELKG